MEKKRRHSYTSSYKLQVVKYAEEHGNRQAERHFGPPPTEKMIRTWRGQKEALQNSRKEKRAERGKNAKWPELEYSVLKWVQENRENGIAISTKMIRTYAINLACERNIEDFKGGESWCYRFMKRSGLCMRTKTKISQKMPKEYEDKIISFHKYVIQQRKNFHF